MSNKSHINISLQIMYRKTGFHFTDVTEAQRVLLVIFHVVVRIMVLSAFKAVVKTLVAHRLHQQGSEGSIHFAKNLLSAAKRKWDLSTICIQKQREEIFSLPRLKTTKLQDGGQRQRFHPSHIYMR